MVKRNLNSKDQIVRKLTGNRVLQENRDNQKATINPSLYLKVWRRQDPGKRQLLKYELTRFDFIV